MASPQLSNLFPNGEVTTCLAALLPQLSTLPKLFSAAGLSMPNILGHHYFNTAGTPVFDLSATNERLLARKVAGVPAVGTACPNADGKGAVDWLMLVDNGASLGGLKAVYRVETAGGKAPGSCVNASAVKGIVTSAYSAQYWFYA